jgi:DNA-binding NarL/FixJ family response regulator
MKNGILGQSCIPNAFNNYSEKESSETFSKIRGCYPARCGPKFPSLKVVSIFSFFKKGVMMQEKKRVVIVEDHAILRQGLRSLLDSQEGLEVVGEAEDGLEAVRCIAKNNPDLVLLDLNMPKMDGISVLKETKSNYPDTKIIALTQHKKEEYILEAFRFGAEGYCLKSSPYDELLTAINAVLENKMYISPEISGKVLEGYIEGRETIKEKSSWDTLTQREREVLKLVGEGYKNKEIADYLCISVKTIEKHRANIMHKLDLHTASALTAYAVERGLVTN